MANPASATTLEETVMIHLENARKADIQSTHPDESPISWGINYSILAL